MSVHHPWVAVVLELDQIVRRVPQDEGPVHLDQSFESDAELAEGLYLSLLAEPVQRLEVLGLTKGHPEMTGIEGKILGLTRRPLAEMAYQLITEEVEGDPIGVAPGQLAAELTDVEILGFF
jgi:hypothetical protein